VIGPGLFDRTPFPERLRGHVVDPGPEPRIHGYAVRADLARGVSFQDLGWLALTGELPTEAEAEALALALSWLAPLHVGQGPVHAAVLARITGAPAEVVPAIAVAALGQWVAEEGRRFAALFDWLDGNRADPGQAANPTPTAEDRALHAELAAATGRWFGVPLPLEPVLHREAAAYAVLHRLGVSDPLRLQAFAAWARLPVVLAEACCTRQGGVDAYPARLPDYRYVGGAP
jgi:hypothetical protein